MNRKNIDDQQEVLVDALVYLLEKTRPEDPIAIARLIQCFIDMRTFMDMAKRLVKQFFEDFNDLDVPALTLDAMDEEFVEAYNKSREAQRQQSQEDMDSEMCNVVQSTETLQIITDKEDTLQSDTHEYKVQQN